MGKKKNAIYLKKNVKPIQQEITNNFYWNTQIFANLSQSVRKCFKDNFIYYLFFDF